MDKQFKGGANPGINKQNIPHWIFINNNFVYLEMLMKLYKINIDVHLYNATNYLPIIICYNECLIGK